MASEIQRKLRRSYGGVGQRLWFGRVPSRANVCQCGMHIVTGDGRPVSSGGVNVASDQRIEDLQAVSQHILEGNRRIEELERRKRLVDPASTEFRALSDEIERLAEEMRKVSRAETGLADALAGERGLPTVAESEKRQ